MKLTEQMPLVAETCDILGQKIVQELREQNGCVLAKDTGMGNATKLFHTFSTEGLKFSQMGNTNDGSINQSKYINGQNIVLNQGWSL